MKNEQMNLEMLYTEIAAASSVDFSDKIHEWIKASANTYGTLEEINRLEDIKTLLLKGIEENKILKVVELGKEKLILEYCTSCDEAYSNFKWRGAPDEKTDSGLLEE